MKRLVAALLGAAVMATGAAYGDKLTLDRVFSDPPLSGSGTKGVKLSPDGNSVTWIKPRVENSGVTDLWIADVAGGEPRRLIDAMALIPKDKPISEEEKTRRERQGIQTSGVVDYQWDEQGKFILVPVEGDLWLYTLASNSTRRLTETSAGEIDAKVSPKGGYVSFVRSDNLVIMPATGGAEVKITTDGSELKSWATAEYIAQEEMSRYTGYWWSPDDMRIALAHVDQTTVDVVPRPDVNATGAVVVNQRYPRVGRPNAVVELWIHSLKDGKKTRVDLGTNTDIYLARVAWARDGKSLYVQREARDQRKLDLLQVDPATGKSKVILTETSPHWIELSDDFRPLKTGNFLWSSERSGYRHLYLYRGNGELIRQVTSGDWPVDEINGIDEEGRTVFFGASLSSPLQRHLYEVSYGAPKAPRQLTTGQGWWTGEVSAKGYVGAYEDPATPPNTGVYKLDGSRVRWIEENRLAAGHPYFPFLSRLRAPTYGTLAAPDGQLMQWMMRTPPGFEEKKKYPVIVQVYGGPASQLVKRKWMTPSDQLYLEAGYILFTLDNRGTPNRSVAFKTAIDRKMGMLETDDQVAGATYLRSLPYVDGTRIGITGWSNGGFMTLLTLTAKDSPFAAGVAGAPPTDFRLYDTHYTERFMGTDANNHQGYQDQDILNRIDNLRPNALMLVHGMADDNVTFDNTTRLMYALQHKGIPFEMQLYPGLRHRSGWSPATLEHRTEAMLDFFNRRFHPEAVP